MSLRGRNRVVRRGGFSGGTTRETKNDRYLMVWLDEWWLECFISNSYVAHV
jgi:hypothetical protein